MATASVTYDDFVNGANSDADQVDQNFADLVAFLNANVVHVDGSKSMSGLLTLAAADPTADRHAVSKGWSDGPYLNCRTGAAQTYTSGVPLSVKFTAPEEDTDSAYSGVTGQYTCPRAGLYQVSWSMAAINGSSVVHAMDVAVNGVQYIGPRLQPSSVVVGASPHPVMSLTVRCDVGHLIAPRATLDANTTQTLGEWLTIAWLHG